MPLYNVSLFCMTITALLILLPLLCTKDFPLQAKRAISAAFFMSLIPLYFLLNESTTALFINFTWVHLGQTDLPACFQLDKYSIIFTPVALFVTWSILQFSLWYMKADPNIDTFFKYLLVFLLAMITLISAGNLFLLFIGWEGVGILSFLLIGWYHARTNAATAALQAMLYNRIGDMGFLIAFTWLVTNLESTHLQIILMSKPPLIVTLGFILAAASKSAQFSLHPWLASAMEGPTPVSALLHSSTMVVAGIFLTIRIHPLIAENPVTLSTCLCLGAISTAFAATSALLQNDIKKIIAYSTSSQLGLMMVAIGINMPHLAFLHICTHAFFKAMLFLCSGYIIHTIHDEQDIRKMGGLQLSLPLTTTSISIGSIALMGLPFLAGFFSKDAIIEAILNSHISSAALWLTIIATAFTATYSLRLIFYATLSHPRTHNTTLNENTPLIFLPLARLACGTILAGPLIHHIVTPLNPTIHTMPTYIKLSALGTTLMALILAYDLINLHSSTMATTPKPLNTDFYNLVIQRTFSALFLDFALLLVTHAIENISLKTLFPEMVRKGQLLPSKTAQATQSGLIKSYLSTLLVSLALAMSLSLLV